MYNQIRINPQYQHLTIDETVGMLVACERDRRCSRRATRCLQRSGLTPLEAFNQATFEAGVFSEKRGLSENQVRKLLTCDWIENNPYNLLVTGKTGMGKTWLLALIGKAACMKGITVQYIRFSRLLEEMIDARLHNESMKYRTRLNRNKLLIIDDFGTDPINEELISGLLSLISERESHSSIIIAGQMPLSEWHGYLSVKRNADAIVDRLFNTSFILELQGDSMREQKVRRVL